MRSRLKLAAACVGASALPISARAATVTVVPKASVPLSSPASPFDVSRPGNGYSLGPDTTLNPQPGAPFNYDVRDLFGGTFQTFANEVGNVIFADGKAVGHVETVNVTLPSPISIAGYELYLGEDTPGNANRSTRAFRLYAGSTLVSNVTLLDNTGTQSYFTRYGGDYLRIREDIASAPASASYRLEFEQNLGSGISPGLRAMEFAIIPEPASLGMIGGIVLLLTRRPKT